MLTPTRNLNTKLYPKSEAEAAAEHAKEIEAARLKAQGPGEGDLGELLAGVVDVAVMDAPRALYEPRRKLPWGPVPTTGLTVAGSGKSTMDGGPGTAYVWFVFAFRRGHFTVNGHLAQANKTSDKSSDTGQPYPSRLAGCLGGLRTLDTFGQQPSLLVPREQPNSHVLFVKPNKNPLPKARSDK